MPYGTLGADVVQSSTSGTPPQFNDGNGTQVGTLCRAWVNYNGLSASRTIRASFNVSSVTYNSTGNYTLNFTNALPDANYMVSLACLADTAGSSTRNLLVINGASSTGASTKTTTQLNILSGQTNTATIIDTAEVNVAIFR